MRILVRSAYFIIAALFCVSCASKIKKAEIPANANPTAEINRLEKLIQDGKAQHADLIAGSEFSKAQKYLKNAKENISENKTTQVVLDDVAYAQAYIDVALEKTKTHKQGYESLIEAREKAVAAGVNNIPELVSRKISVDECAQYHADDFTTPIKPEKIHDLTERYHALELIAIQHNKLAPVRSLMDQAIEQNANRVAPQSYRSARAALKEAEKKIMENRYEDSQYQQLIAIAQTKAEQLTRIMSLIKGSASGTKLNETVALQSLQQKRTIASPPEENK